VQASEAPGSVRAEKCSSAAELCRTRSSRSLDLSSCSWRLLEEGSTGVPYWASARPEVEHRRAKLARKERRMRRYSSGSEKEITWGDSDLGWWRRWTRGKREGTLGFSRGSSGSFLSTGSEAKSLFCPSAQHSTERGGR
jgi:hypothetical protein